MPKLIRNTYAGWVSSNPVLALEDTGFERDTGRSKIGDGVKAWNDLNYFNEAPTGPAGRSSIDPVEFGDPVTAKLRYEIIPPGGFQEVFYDNFSTDTLDNVTRYPNGRGSHTVNASGHVVSSVAKEVLVAGPALDAKRVTGKQTALGAVSEGGILIAVTPDGWKLVFQYIYVSTVSPTGWKTQLGAGMGPAATWNRITKQGSLLTRERFTADPRLGGAVIGVTTYDLPIVEATRFAGVLPAGVFNEVASTTSGMDDLTIDKVLSEQRRLVADIDHPAGGVISTVIASA